MLSYQSNVCVRNLRNTYTLRYTYTHIPTVIHAQKDQHIHTFRHRHADTHTHQLLELVGNQSQSKVSVYTPS